MDKDAFLGALIGGGLRLGARALGGSGRLASGLGRGLSGSGRALSSAAPKVQAAVDGFGSSVSNIAARGLQSGANIAGRAVGTAARGLQAVGNGVGGAMRGMRSGWSEGFNRGWRSPRGAAPVYKGPRTAAAPQAPPYAAAPQAPSQASTAAENAALAAGARGGSGKFLSNLGNAARLGFEGYGMYSVLDDVGVI